ncbi:Inner membrane protein forms channel for type IV secretion of T-DNA complex VirB3 (plasmid) [Salmonella enterica]|nr:Inner membrane protein forms channel for type IV secretion of T-DNA complex VirB3 [Salmonella enterica]
MLKWKVFIISFSGKEKGNTWGEKLITLRGSGNDIYHLNYHMTTEHQNFFGKEPDAGAYRNSRYV